ncbi:response regulator transcription factor [Faecalibacterium wellingii]|uniref:Stage 0 sporulation protein A homolog n=1 Tax=Faecalibacterium wellingii TaxID=2929491 RepID=A0ABU3TZB5_9FIRM|nr:MULTISPECIES: response regulator transcription factor [Faecalibacterium]MDU8688596.1 response regulator transcription factor [Faecalibacterium prausnitzii]UQK55640.1 response regulator transcription factor [Faecalibacterium sp. HTF-F]
MRVLLVDDHALFAKSLSIALCDFPEIDQFSSTKDIKNLENHITTEQPDILLIDINLGGLTNEDGLMLTQHLLKHFPEQKIVILSGYNLPVYHKEAKRIGAKGFISKDVEPDELLHILMAIRNGTTYFPQEKIFIEDLTEGEKKVLELVSTGAKRKEIAKQLFISERTVSNHLQHIFEKLQVGSTVEAVTKAIQIGYISPVK